MSTIPAGTAWSTALLAILGAPATPANYQFLNQWAIREHGTAQTLFANNPFFTTAGGRGTVGPIKAGTYPLIPDSAFGGGKNTAGVPAYPDISTGVGITGYHLKAQYPAVVAALKSGNPGGSAANPQFQRELTAWSGGGYSGFQSIAAPSGPIGPTLNKPTDTGVLSSIIGGDGGANSSVTSAAGKVVGWSPLPGVGHAITGAVEAPVKAAVSVADFLGKLTNPSYILRGLQVLGGAALVGVGVTLLARQVALAADLPDPAKLAPATAAGAIE